MPLFLDQTLWLRLCLNRILTTIYMMNNHYGNPRFLGRPISSITSELEFWYRSLPIELQFPRTLAAYGLLTNTIPSYKVSMASLMVLDLRQVRSLIYPGESRLPILLLPLHAQPTNRVLSAAQRDREMRNSAQIARRLPRP